MILKELEMDLPYTKNNLILQQEQVKKDIKCEDSAKEDYEKNWKMLRRNFQLMTRCMTAMIERIMPTIKTSDCWKIVFECVENVSEEKYKNLLGVYVIQVPLDIVTFLSLSDYEKKKITILKIMEGIDKMSLQIPFTLNGINEACMQIISSEYLNEWMWKKPLKINNNLVQIKIQHDVRELNIYMVFMDENKRINRQELLITTTPDERVYSMYLGKLERSSENEVTLITLSGERYVRRCD